MHITLLGYISVYPDCFISWKYLTKYIIDKRVSEFYNGFKAASRYDCQEMVW